MTELEVADVVSWIERIAVLEVRVEQLTMLNKSIHKKLDELLEMRAKGVGAFWLASSLLGTGIVGLLINMIHWIKG